MRAVHESQPFAQRSTARRSSWWQRIADLIAAFALVVAVTPAALAQPVEIAYNTFLDPNNASDPRAAAQTKMIAEFERQNPNIKIRVVVDPTGANGARTLRTHADSPDVVRATSFQMPEYVATCALLQLDGLVKRDKIDQNDWLVPLSAGMVGGHLFGLQQDYRIPILIYRERLLEEAKVTPPRTWTEVCETGAKLSKNNVVGYAIPIGTTGGIGGAQAFGELHLSTLLAAPDGKYFADDNKTIAFSKESFVRGAERERGRRALGVARGAHVRHVPAIGVGLGALRHDARERVALVEIGVGVGDGHARRTSAQNTASGLAGLPVPPVSRNGARVNRNS